jgi:hypothetical protein
VARGIFGNILKTRVVVGNFGVCGLICGKCRGLFIKLAGIFFWGNYFPKEMSWTMSMAHGPAQGVVHGGPTTMASHRAQWS